MASHTAAQTLEEAYRTELTRLKAEQDSMRKSLQASTLRSKRARAALVQEIKSLSRTLTELRVDNNQQELKVPQTTRLQSLQEQERNIDRRARQIETWLETHGVPLPAQGTQATDGNVQHEHPPLDLMMQAALAHVEEHGQLWLRKSQEYFGTDGNATQGPVLRIAEVGAVAVEPTFQALELALDGSLRVSSRGMASSLTEGKIQVVDTVLFDPDDIRLVKNKDEDWQDWMNKGGTIMWVIGALGLLALLIFLERILAYCRYALRIWAAERKGPNVSVRESDSLLRAVAAIQNSQADPDALESQAAEQIMQTQPFVKRGVSLLAVVAAVAPLLGLLGTVTGMIGTFAMITEHGTGDPRLLSGGISEALLTTQFGLMVAIPALLFQTTLYRMGDGIIRRIESFAMITIRTKTAVAEQSVSLTEADGVGGDAT